MKVGNKESCVRNDPVYCVQFTAIPL